MIPHVPTPAAPPRATPEAAEAARKPATIAPRIELDASAVHATRSPEPRAAVVFASRAEARRACDEARGRRGLAVAVEWAERGRLGEAIDAAFEGALAHRGALPGRTREGAPWADAIAEQLARAAALPAPRVCVELPRLATIAERGLLDGRDATALSAWIDAARARSFVELTLYVDEADRGVELHAPRRLDRWLADATDAVGTTDTTAPKSASPRATPEQAAAPLAPMPIDTASARFASATHRIDASPNEPSPGASARNEPATREPTRSPRLGDTMRPPSMPAPPVVATARVDDTNEIAERQRADEARRAERAARLVDAATWRAYALELEAARGPRPTAAIERLYVERYVPLLGAIARGECDAGVRQLVEQWRRDFREGYESAFASLRVTAKRPTMVMDAPDVAHRVARLASARSVKLVLVDAMSFDLGDRVAKRLASQLDKRAVLVEKNVLWSALPSTTPTQLHLLARGPEGLKDSLAPATESDVARGRNVVVFRRERLGAREVLKLDVVEARLRAQGDGYDARLDALADELAAALAKLFDTLPPRTLAYVFGDHGFVLGPGANGWATGAGSQGGSSPEEVLVGGQAWLLDAMH